MFSIVTQIMTIRHYLSYVYRVVMGVEVYEGTGMTQPTTAVSLRITEEDLALLDARVGFDGARNRSDVVRLAIQEFLHNQPLLADMKSIRIPLGRHDQLQLGKLYELQGTTPEVAAQEGLKLYIKKATAELQVVSDTLDSVLEASRAETIRRSEYQQ
jgi:Arc/MetJ-type ribon-helix-helix transcriptional regulator